MKSTPTQRPSVPGFVVASGTSPLIPVHCRLRLLEEMGVASAVRTDPDPVRHDANRRPHHQFVGTKCRAVRDCYPDEAGQSGVPEEVRAWVQVT